MNYDYDLIIIGGGSGGLSLASGAAQLGVKVLLINKDDLGGDCLHYGCVPSKSLIKSAKVAAFFRHADKYGIKSYIPECNWKDITERIASIQSVIQKHDSPRRFESLGCEVLFGHAQFIDTHTVQIDYHKMLNQKIPKQTKFSAKKIVIATGSRPSIPSISGLHEAGFITNETLFTLPQQPKSLFIIGSGIVSLEMAQAMARLGTKIFIGMRGKQLMPHLDAEVTEIIKRSLEADGVEFLSDITLKKVEKKNEEKLISYAQKNKINTLAVEEVLVAAGRSANLDLCLDRAGVAYDRHITVDSKLRTSQKHIYAIGDVNGKTPFTHGANYQAGIVLSNAILHIPSKANHGSIGWAIFTHPEVASIGENEISAKKKNLAYQVIESRFTTQDRALAESETDGLMRIIIDKKSKILGCQIVAPQAGDMIREWQLAIAEKIPLSKIARSAFVYPTFAEASKWTAGSYFSPKLFSPRVKKILKWIFGYRGK